MRCIPPRPWRGLLRPLPLDGVLAAVTAGEAIELVLNPRIALRNNGARSLPGNMLASVVASCLVLRWPLSSVGRRSRG